MPLPKAGDIEDDIPTVKYEKKPKEEKTYQKQANENNALLNWQKKMRERKIQQGYISSLVVEHNVLCTQFASCVV